MEGPRPVPSFPVQKQNGHYVVSVVTALPYPVLVRLTARPGMCVASKGNKGENGHDLYVVWMVGLRDLDVNVNKFCI